MLCSVGYRVTPAGCFFKAVLRSSHSWGVRRINRRGFLTYSFARTPWGTPRMPHSSNGFGSEKKPEAPSPPPLERIVFGKLIVAWGRLQKDFHPALTSCLEALCQQIGQQKGSERFTLIAINWNCHGSRGARRPLLRLWWRKNQAYTRETFAESALLGFILSEKIYERTVAASPLSFHIFINLISSNEGENSEHFL